MAKNMETELACADCGQIKRRPLNMSAEQVWLFYPTTPWGGGETLYLNDKEAEGCNADPDDFAAEHFGMTKAEYYEWIDLGGTALCSRLNKNGKPCGQAVSKIQQGPGAWLSLHRKRPCAIHSKNGRAK
jgi:hypothetical protein